MIMTIFCRALPSILTGVICAKLYLAFGNAGLFSGIGCAILGMVNQALYEAWYQNKRKIKNVNPH